MLIGDDLHRGAVEIHRRASEWFEHGHDRDPAYENVVLHAVWADDGAVTGLPTLVMEEQLHSGWRRLFQEVKTAFYPMARQVPPGACSVRWALTDDEPLRQILKSAGWSRFCRHGQELMRDSVAKGVNQTLYEQVFEGLGYANNRRQFRQLASQMPLKVLPEDPDEMLVLLCGSAGFLPDYTRDRVRPELQDWLEQAWKWWWSSGLTAQPIDWNNAGARPLNSVFRRLAAGVEWLSECERDPVKWLERCVSEAGNSPACFLKRLLKPWKNIQENPWRHYRDFNCRLAAPAGLLGRERQCDLILNVWLPFLAAQADNAGDNARLELVRQTWELLPRGQENHVLRMAAHRFLSPPSRAQDLLKRASQQQGMMEIYQNFCQVLDHDCNDCPFVVK